jgi:hypothetical protein
VRTQEVSGASGGVDCARAVFASERASNAENFVSLEDIVVVASDLYRGD